MYKVQLGVLFVIFCSMSACGSFEHPTGMQGMKRDSEHTSAAARPAEPDEAKERRPTPQLGGQLVRGSEVFLPRTAKAGGAVDGRAPAGSTVYFQGQRVTVGQDGAYELLVPPDTAGSLPVRIERPGQPPVTLRLRIEPD